LVSPTPVPKPVKRSFSLAGFGISDVVELSGSTGRESVSATRMMMKKKKKKKKKTTMTTMMAARIGKIKMVK
jgi:hypothetical protein